MINLNELPDCPECVSEGKPISGKLVPFSALSADSICGTFVSGVLPIGIWKCTSPSCTYQISEKSE